jgi:hypothetical protein
MNRVFWPQWIPPFRKPLLVLVLSVAIVGCGKQLAEVSGIVTYKGNALKNGTVTFLGNDGVPYQAEINPDGSYRTKVFVGDAKVGVICNNDEEMVKEMKALSAGGRGMKDATRPRSGSRPPKNWSLIPKKYNDAANSGLTTTVKRGKNTYDIPLE